MGSILREIISNSIRPAFRSPPGIYRGTDWNAMALTIERFLAGKPMDGLSAKQLAAWRCKVIDKLTRQETSAKLKISPNRVKNLWQEVRRRVRDRTSPELLAEYDALACES